MANQHGGYRRPENPAAVSGPGALSKRTDGGPGQPMSRMTGLGYGENKAYMEQQTGAPMADSTDSATRPGGLAPLAPLVPLDAPSAMPGEHVTAGAEMGPGPGPSVLGPAPQRKVTDMLMNMIGPDDVSGDLEELYLRAESLGM